MILKVTKMALKMRQVILICMVFIINVCDSSVNLSNQGLINQLGIKIPKQGKINIRNGDSWNNLENYD